MPACSRNTQGCRSCWQPDLPVSDLPGGIQAVLVAPRAGTGTPGLPAAAGESLAPAGVCPSAEVTPRSSQEGLGEFV